MAKNNRGREPRPSARGTVLVLEKVFNEVWEEYVFVVIDPEETQPEKTYMAIFTEDPFKESING